jgi:hypothetical protein
LSVSSINLQAAITIKTINPSAVVIKKTPEVVANKAITEIIIAGIIALMLFL